MTGKEKQYAQDESSLLSCGPYVVFERHFIFFHVSFHFFFSCFNNVTKIRRNTSLASPHTLLTS